MRVYAGEEEGSTDFRKDNLVIKLGCKNQMTD